MEKLKKWLKDSENIEYSDEIISIIGYFTILWNVYERNLFNRDFKINKIKDFVTKQSWDIEDFQSNFNYFVNRYTESDTQSPNSLCIKPLHQDFFDDIRPPDLKTLAEKVLTGSNNTTNEIVEVCLIIAARYRNNMFHGVKDPFELESQKENFKNALELLYMVLVRKGCITEKVENT
jgi:hypothetical protein